MPTQQKRELDRLLFDPPVLLFKKAAIPAAFAQIFEPFRYKVFHGGRAGGKSWSIARALVTLAAERPLLILCTREFQNSIEDSVHHLLETQIEELGLTGFTVGKKVISHENGSRFIFKGLQKLGSLKSLEGVDICWVEEAQGVSARSWEILGPTIRKKGSEIWVSFNPDDVADPTYAMFITKTMPDSLVVKVNYYDNPHFDETELKQEMEYCRQNDEEAYQHIWEGNPKTIGDAVIFKGKYRVESFEAPEGAEFKHGADWGFSQDPTALIRCFIQKEDDPRNNLMANCLYIDYEAFGHGVDIDDTPALFDTIDTARTWPIKADCSRPETISYMNKQKFKITGAKKWQGSVEDGIAHLRAFKWIIIHPRCRHLIDEARLYQYKIDSKTGDILPIIVDKHNHGWDAVRYSLDGHITNKGRARTLKVRGL